MKRELKALQYRVRDALDYVGRLIIECESDDPRITLLHTHLIGASDCLDDLGYSILDIPRMKKKRNRHSRGASELIAQFKKYELYIKGVPDD